MTKYRAIYSIGIILLCLLFLSLVRQPSSKSQQHNFDPDKIEQFVKEQMDSLKIPGLSIAIFSNEKVFYSQTLGVKNIETKEKVDSNTLFEACSLTKPIFAYTVVKLSEEGVLDLDTPLYKYFPNTDLLEDERHKLITARMILSHTSGLPNWREDNLTINFNPGTKFSYSGEGYEYLGSVIEHITGKNLQDVIQKEVFTPLHIQNSYFIENEYLKYHMATGHIDNNIMGRNKCKEPHMAYSLCTNAKEYSKFIRALMNESKMPNSTFNKMSVPHYLLDSIDNVCLGIFTEKTPTGLQYNHSGNNDDRFNSSFEFYIDKNIGYVYFINCNKRREFTKELENYLGYYKNQ